MTHSKSKKCQIYLEQHRTCLLYIILFKIKKKKKKNQNGDKINVLLL